MEDDNNDSGYYLWVNWKPVSRKKREWVCCGIMEPNWLDEIYLQGLGPFPKKVTLKGWFHRIS